MIRMYWWQGGRGTGNFGDKLGPALVSALSGRAVVHSAIEKSDLIAIGSSLEPWLWPDNAWLHYRGMIWGTGRLDGRAFMKFPQAEILATRGELSLGSLCRSGQSSAVTGDPALLCGHVHHSIGRPRYKLGIWPHWSEVRNSAIRRLAEESSDVAFIDPCGGIRETLDLAAKCECIASSALHGLVVADALAIPNCWIRPGMRDDCDTLYKYFDYFSSFQSPPPKPKTITAADNIDSLLPLMSSDRHEDASRLQDDLLAVFPYYRCASLT
jgi:pyruvyltransferase